MMQTPAFNSPSTSDHTTVCALISRSEYRRSAGSVSVTRFSTNLRNIDLIAGGVVITTAALSLAERSFSIVACVPAVARSHANVYSRFWIVDENVRRRMSDDILRSAGGTHCITR